MVFSLHVCSMNRVAVCMPNFVWNLLRRESDCNSFLFICVISKIKFLQ